jgi:hypothetical protein
MLPQDRALSRVFWETAATRFGWNKLSKPVRTPPGLRWPVLAIELETDVGEHSFQNVVDSGL